MAKARWGTKTLTTEQGQGEVLEHCRIMYMWTNHLHIQEAWDDTVMMYKHGTKALVIVSTHHPLRQNCLHCRNLYHLESHMLPVRCQALLLMIKWFTTRHYNVFGISTTWLYWSNWVAGLEGTQKHTQSSPLLQALKEDVLVQYGKSGMLILHLSTVSRSQNAIQHCIPTYRYVLHSTSIPKEE